MKSVLTKTTFIIMFALASGVCGAQSILKMPVSLPRQSGSVAEFLTDLNKLPGVAISYDLDGRELWRINRMGAVAIQSPFAWNDILFVTSGTSGDDNKPIVAIRPGGAGDITPPESVNKKRTRRVVRAACRRYLSADTRDLQECSVCAL